MLSHSFHALFLIVREESDLHSRAKLSKIGPHGMR